VVFRAHRELIDRARVRRGMIATATVSVVSGSSELLLSLFALQLRICLSNAEGGGASLRGSVVFLSRAAPGTRMSSSVGAGVVGPRGCSCFGSGYFKFCREP